MMLGADLSYVNEMEDCGGVYRDGGEVRDPFELFADYGCDIVRVRLWHSPEWTSYSTLHDVTGTIRRARDQGMRILLDFHYSDDWADPGDQIVPAAWLPVVADTETLGDSLYNYTREVLLHLHKEGLLPEYVQVGNETNSEILLTEHVDELTEPIGWPRNVHLFNRALQAVDDVRAETGTGTGMQSMIHIAQPEFVAPWLDSARSHGLAGFDWLGLSYYPKWSAWSMDLVGEAIDSFRRTYGLRVMVVETAYPYTLESYDGANNLLGEDALVLGYPATPGSQLRYLDDLTGEVLSGGGEGVIYWEPAWIPTPCSTRWGQGSHWENAIFFDAGNANETLPAMAWLDAGRLAEE